MYDDEADGADGDDGDGGDGDGDGDSDDANGGEEETDDNNEETTLIFREAFKGSKEESPNKTLEIKRGKGSQIVAIT
eukprot:1664887-Pyramimonas_sp.AAC.1